MPSQHATGCERSIDLNHYCSLCKTDQSFAQTFIKVKSLKKKNHGKQQKKKKITEEYFVLILLGIIKEKYTYLTAMQSQVHAY